MSRSRSYNDTSHDADAVCDKLELVVDAVCELEQTMDGARIQLCRIATALEKLANIPAASTVGTLA